jgi:hypothetical protein
MGDHVWLMTSRQTDPDLVLCQRYRLLCLRLKGHAWNAQEYRVQFVDVRVEDAVNEANAGALVRVLIGQLDVDLPESALEGCCMVSGNNVSRKPNVLSSGPLNLT